MISLRQICKTLEAFAPLQHAESWDNCGLQVGDLDWMVETVYFTLDLNRRSLRLAQEAQANLIVTHHPFFFSGVKQVTCATLKGDQTLSLIQKQIAVYSAHTNLDAAVGGVNEALANKLGLNVESTLFPLVEDGKALTALWKGKSLELGFVRLCSLPEVSSFSAFVKQLQTNLASPSVFCSGFTEYRPKRIAISGGSWDSSWNSRLREAQVDTLIAGEIKHHDLMDLEDMGIRALAIGHEVSERPVMESLATYLQQAHSDLCCLVDTGLPYSELF